MLKALAIAAASLSLAVGAAPLAAQDQTREERAEQAFQELIKGRTPGEPTKCINAFQPSRLRVVEYVGLVYERGDTIWVARARNPRSLDQWDVPVIERYGSQLCTSDVMRTIDRTTGMFSGAVFLDDWVPYTLNEEAADE